jgi:putative ABC transport system permease protein
MRDLRSAFRSLLATPVVSSVAILSLALGIGANTALFSIVNAIVLRSLPVRDADRLVIVGNAADPEMSWTNPIWEALRDAPAVFDGTFAWAATRFDLASSGDAEMVPGVWVSGGYFKTLGVPAALGRTITPADDRRGGGPDGPVAVISHGFWQRRFGGAPAVVGRQLTIERVPYTIVGVIPPAFTGLEVGYPFDVAVPIGTEPLVRRRDSQLDSRSSWWLNIGARLGAGQTIASATTAVRALQPRIRAATLPGDWPPALLEGYLRDAFTLQAAAGGVSSLRARYERPLLTLLGVVALVLVVACANIANLSLARSTARRHEFAVRLALGASRAALARLLLVESLVVAGCGAAVGLLFARWGSQLLVAQLSTAVTAVRLDLSLDWRVLLFTSGVTAATALLFGTAPAIRASRVQPFEGMTPQVRGIVGGGHTGLTSTLVVVQVALSLVLVVAAGLFVRTFTRLATLDTGFDRDRVMVAMINAGQSPQQPAERLATFDRIAEEVRSVPGVAIAAASTVTPVSNSSIQYGVAVDGAPALSERARQTFANVIGPRWFATYGTRIVAGRDFDERDAAGSRAVAIVNETFVRRFLPGTSPLGRIVRQDPAPRDGPQPVEIVGVVQDAVYRSLREGVPPTMYLPLAQARRVPPFIRISVRSATQAPAALRRALTAAITRVRPDLVVTYRVVREQVDASLMRERLVAMIAGFFGALALLLAGLGLYGVTSYSVSRRRAEIGIRMALGAAPRGVVRQVVARVARLVAAGILAGAIAAAWSAQLVGSLLFGIEPRDLPTFAVAAAALGTVAALAAWLPARRAARIDPASVLHD